MFKRFQWENLYRTTLAWEIPAITSIDWSNNLDIFDIEVATAPKNSKWWIIIDFTNTSKRDLIYFHDVSWTTLKYYRKDRDLLLTWAIWEQHEEWAIAQINDVSEWIDYLFANVDDFWKVEDMSGNRAAIQGWKIDYWTTNIVTVSDLSATALADWTWYAVFNYSTWSLAFVSSFDSSIHLKLATVIVASSEISSITDDRHTYVFKNRSVLDKLSESGGNLLFDGVPIGGGAGTGDVVWPSSSVTDNIVTFDNITGKVIKDSWKSIKTTLNDSDNEVPTSKAVVDYTTLQKQDPDIVSIYPDTNYDRWYYSDTTQRYTNVYNFSTNRLIILQTTQTNLVRIDWNSQQINIYSVNTNYTPYSSIIYWGKIWASIYDSWNTKTLVVSIPMGTDLSIWANWTTEFEIAWWNYVLIWHDWTNLCFSTWSDSLVRPYSEAWVAQTTIDFNSVLWGNLSIYSKVFVGSDWTPVYVISTDDRYAYVVDASWTILIWGTWTAIDSGATWAMRYYVYIVWKSIYIYVAFDWPECFIKCYTI